jgi:hypothetical protein
MKEDDNAYLSVSNFIPLLMEGLGEASIKKGVGSHPTPFKVFKSDPKSKIKNHNKLMKKNSAIRLYNNSQIKYPYLKSGVLRNI